MEPLKPRMHEPLQQWPMALLPTMVKHDVDARETLPEESVLIPAARRLNDSMPGHIAAKIRRAVRDRQGVKIGCYGVTYKPDVNDERESPPWQIINNLKPDGYDVTVYDPVVEVGDFVSFEDFASKVDVVVVLVEHQQFLDVIANSASCFDGKTLMRF